MFFLLDRLCFSKLLKLHQTEGISSNLLKRKQYSRKISIVCRRLKMLDIFYATCMMRN